MFEETFGHFNVFPASSPLNLGRILQLKFKSIDECLILSVVLVSSRSSFCFGKCRLCYGFRFHRRLTVELTNDLIKIYARNTLEF